MRTLRRWWALPGRDRARLLALWLLLPPISLALRTAGYRRTLCWIHGLSAPRAPRGSLPTLAESHRLAELAAIAGRQHGSIDATCLRQSLAVLWWLRRRGAQPEIRFGVDNAQGAPDMHAWVELDGERLGQGTYRHRPFHH